MKSKSVVVSPGDNEAYQRPLSGLHSRSRPVTKNFDLARDEISKQDVCVNPEDARSYHDFKNRWEESKNDLMPD